MDSVCRLLVCHGMGWGAKGIEAPADHLAELLGFWSRMREGGPFLKSAMDATVSDLVRVAGETFDAAPSVGRFLCLYHLCRRPSDARLKLLLMARLPCCYLDSVTLTTLLLHNQLGRRFGSLCRRPIHTTLGAIEEETVRLVQRLAVAETDRPLIWRAISTLVRAAPPDDMDGGMLGWIRHPSEMEPAAELYRMRLEQLGTDARRGRLERELELLTATPPVRRPLVPAVCVLAA